jgi:predicted O-methyltransferase YrrM
MELPVIDDTGIWNAWMTMLNVPAISASLELGIFESLNTAPASAIDLARRLGYQERAMKALLPVLCHLGFLNDYNGAWQLSPMARQYMLEDSAFFWGGVFRREGRMLVRHKLLIETITGKREKHEGRDRPAESWESGQVDMAMAREITAFMHSHSMAAAVGMTHSADFSRISRVLDVGGGSGCFMIALAQALPDISCTIMELPSICELAREYIAEGGVSERVDTISVDMFREKWPAGYDAHFFSNIFHDWSFDTCRELAKSSFEALEPGGKILLHEMLLHDSGHSPYPAINFSLLMAIGTLGQQFTLPQLEDILQSAGFVNVSSLNTYGYYSIVSAEKPA